MPQVFIPSSLRSLSGGREVVAVSGATVRAVIEALDRECPGTAELIMDEDRIRPGIQIAVDGTVAALGLLEQVPEDSEIHILPAIGGGAPVFATDGMTGTMNTDEEHEETLT